MKLSLNSIFAALLTAHCGLTLATAVSTREPRIETRTIVIENDGLAGNVDDVIVNASVLHAQASPLRIHTDVRLQTQGEKGEKGQLHAGTHLSLPALDTLISSAMSEAFSNSTNGFTSATRKPVKNTPYSAEVISEKIQSLPDGNQITRRSSSVAYRDSVGRTRQESRDAMGEVRTIHINDAVEGTHFVMSPSTKTATKIGLDKDMQKRIDEITEKARAMAKNSKHPVTIQSENNGDTVVVKRSENAIGEGRKEIREEVKVRVVRSGDSSGANTGVRAISLAHEGGSIGNAISESMRSGPFGLSFQDGKWSSKAITTELGTRDFDGVRAEGKLRSYTIPAGEIGNKNPITVTSETWFSPDLQATVYSKQSDPRSGDSIYRLANVLRVEQPLSLFSVPADYTVRDGHHLDASALKLKSGPSNK